MRILLLAHRLPYPPNKGDKIRSFNILQHLCARHEVHVACPIDDAGDLAHLSELRRRCAGLLSARIDTRRRVTSACKSLVRGSPITVEHFYSKDLAEQIDAMLDATTFDAFFCFSSPMAEYLLRSRHANGQIARAICILDLIDVDSYKWRQYAQACRGPRAWVYEYEARQLGRYESAAIDRFDRTFVVSEQERQYLPASAATQKVAAMANGVDLDYFQPGDESLDTVNAPLIVFTGVMDYWPNVQGVQWFVERVFPRVRAEIPAARFTIVGSKPTAAVQRLAQVAGVEVTGFVPDVRRYLREASLCVVPLTVARGLQNKVLEAMAMAKAVVATPQSLEGIRAAIGEEVVCASGETEFAAKTIELINDRARAVTLGRRARSCVENNYSWAKNLAELDVLLPAGIQQPSVSTELNYAAADR